MRQPWSLKWTDNMSIAFDHTLTDSEDAHRTLVAMLRAMPKQDRLRGILGTAKPCPCTGIC